VLFGRPGNNPYCHYRVLELAKKGLRERVAKTHEAPGTPFDQGKFDLITEPLDGGPGECSVAVPPHWEMKEPELRATDRLPPTLDLCYGCMQYVHAGTKTCDHCGGDIAAFAVQQREVEEAIVELRRLIAAANGATKSAIQLSST
jgi:hypothetical protein